MTENIVKFPERGSVREEAGAWLIKLDGDEPLCAKELEGLREWLTRSAVHREELARLAELWDKMNVLTELAVPLGKPERSGRGADNNWPMYSNGVRPLPAVAGMIGLGIAIAALFWLRLDPFVESNGFYATAVGQQKSVTLVDGSVVELNTDTQIQVSFGEKHRDVRMLQGEAYFTVAKDAEKPFRVYAGNGRVQAIGTAFSVYLNSTTVDVTVVEGRVALAALKTKSREDQHVTRDPALIHSEAAGEVGTTGDQYVEAMAELKGGERASIARFVEGDVSILDKKGGIEILLPSDLEKGISWRKGYLTFQGDPLQEVVEEISRYTTVSIDIADPAIGTIKIGGMFRVGETQAMLDALEANFGLQVSRVGPDRMLLSRASD